MTAPAKAFGRVKRWCSTTTWGSARWQRGLAAAVAALIFWPQSSVDPVVGLDPSWQAGFALARVHQLAWGPEVEYTYGPLGFLQTTAYYSFDQSLLATIYQPIIVAALFLGIASALRQRYAPMTSLIAAFITTGMATFLHIGLGLELGESLGMMYPELAVLAAFAWAAGLLLQQDPKRSTAFITCTVLGVAAGLQLLVKPNTGLAIVVIALAASVLLDWRAVGRHFATVSAFAASVPIWWVLAGQRPGDLPAWLRYTAAVISGYGEERSMLLGPQALPAVVLILAWIAALCMMFVRGGPEIPRRFVVLVGLATLLAAKTAFAHLEPWHFGILLGLIVVAVAITPLSATRVLSGTRRRAFAVAAVVIFVVNVGIGGPIVYFHAIEALQAPAQAVDRLATLALPGHVDRRVNEAQAHQRALYAVPDRFIKTIGAGTVHIDANEASTAWAYNLGWRPAAVFQTYQAYNPTLDSLNSESLTRATQFVLSRLSPASPATGIDGHFGAQESPRYSRALLCDYTVSGVENQWALFTRSGSHCGPLTALSQVSVHDNDVIKVPAPSGPGRAVLVGIDLEPTIVDRLFQGAVAPLAIPTVVLDGVSYRLIAGNAAEPFLVATPSSADGTNLQIHPHTIGVGRAPSLGQGGVAARLRFYEMRVEPTVANTQSGPVAPTAAQTVGRTPPPPAGPKTVIDALGVYEAVIDNDGTYLVGVDIPAGTYRNAGGTACDWARLRSVDPRDIIDSKKTSSPQVVTIHVSDTAFSTQSCGTWQMIHRRGGPM